MRERVHAPKLSGASAWLNTSRPLSLRDLRGQVVVAVEAVACDAGDAACWPVRNSFRLPLRLLLHGQREVRFALPLELRQ